MENHTNIDNLIADEELTWRDIIFGILEDMDPWDVDISELASRYARHVDEMREMNFRIPAQVVLLSSVLLRMKSDLLPLGGPDNGVLSAEEFFGGMEFDVFGLSPEELAASGGNGKLKDGEVPILLTPKRVPKRRISAVELLSAIHDVLEEKQARQQFLDVVSVKPSSQTIIIKAETDIRRLIEETYSNIVELLSGKEEVLFSDLASTREKVIKLFVPLLHLWAKQKVSLTQEFLYGPIHIRAA
ncbi:MAG: hypothetical protein ABH950_00495 [Candidatus Altiarchaeota archaeon]